VSYSVLQRVAACSSAGCPATVAWSCSVMQCVAACNCVLQRVAGSCSVRCLVI